MTGQRLPIQLVNKLGHCISYQKKLGKALVELSIKQSKEFNIFTMLPVAEEIISTYFWVANLEIKVGRLWGSIVVNTTHLMAFQLPNIGLTQSKCTYISANISDNR